MFTVAGPIRGLENSVRAVVGQACEFLVPGCIFVGTLK